MWCLEMVTRFRRSSFFGLNTQTTFLWVHFSVRAWRKALAAIKFCSGLAGMQKYGTAVHESVVVPVRRSFCVVR